MVRLDEWTVALDVPPDFPQAAADTLRDVVTTALADWVTVTAVVLAGRFGDDIELCVLP